MPAERAGTRVERIAIAAVVAFFAARLVFFAVAIDSGVPPDEQTHVGRVLAFATTWGIPPSGPENHALGLLSHSPFLYHWILGRIAALAGLGPSDLVVLRLANAAMALGTLAFGLGFIRLVSRAARTRVLFAVMLTNTLMLTGIGSAVSYDNGANLAAAASFYWAARLARAPSPRSLAALLLALGLGCLVKSSLLPLAVLVAVAAAIRERRRLGIWRESLGDWRSSLRAAGPWLAAAVAVVAIANVALYGGNLVRFGKLVPGFDQVVGLEAARSNRIFARNEILSGYRGGRLAFEEALAATDRIDHAGDRDSTRRQLAGMRKRGDWRLSFPSYALWWGRIMLDRSLGYFGHQVIFRTLWERAVFTGVLLLGIAFAASRWRGAAPPAAAGEGLRIGAGVALAYAAVLLLLVNHPTYVELGVVDAGVQGRYLFPVWVPLLGWLSCALAEDAPVRFRTPLAVAVGALFVYADLPTFLLRASPFWFGSAA